MEKIFKILIVFGLLMFLVSRFTRGRIARFREYVYRGRKRGDFLREVAGEVVLASPALTEDPENGLLFRVMGTTLEVWDKEQEQGIATVVVNVPVEAVLFDREARVIYCAGILSALFVIRQKSREEYEMVQWLTIPEGCSTVGLAMADKSLYCQCGEFYYTFTPA